MLTLEKFNSISKLFLLSGISLIPISILELYYGRYFSSYILIEDSYHGLVDAITILLVALFLRVVHKRSKRFPMGLYNLENLIVIGSSLLILYYSVDALIQSLSSKSSVPIWASGLTIANALITGSIYIAERKYSWLLLVKNDIAHAKLDIMMEGVSSAGLVIDNYYVSLGIVIAIVAFILKESLKTMKEAILSLVGANCESEFGERVEAMLRGFGIDVRKVYVRRLGSFYSIYIIFGVPSFTPIIEVYKIKKKIQRIVSTLDNVVMTDIRTVPIKIINYDTVPPVGKVNEADRTGRGSSSLANGRE